MNRIIIIGAIALLLGMSGCGNTPPKEVSFESEELRYQIENVDKTVSFVPDWYASLPVDEDMIYSAGSATAPDLQLAVDIATLNAKITLADRIDGKLDSMTKSLVSKIGESVDASVITELERVSKNVINEVDVAGYIPKEVKVFPSDNQYMAFVLLEYSNKEAIKVYTNRLRRQKLFSNDIDELWNELDYETDNIAE